MNTPIKNISFIILDRNNNESDSTKTTELQRFYMEVKSQMDGTCAIFYRLLVSAKTHLLLLLF